MDEAYYEYAGAEDYPQTLPLLEKYENLMVLRTFSKAYGLAAFRIGYAVGNTELIGQLEVARLPFNTSTVAQSVALAALEDQAFLQECVKRMKKDYINITHFVRNITYSIIHLKQISFS